MKPPRSLKMKDLRVGSGPKVVLGDVVVCNCKCTRSRGDTVFSTVGGRPYEIRVGARDYCVGIEYGLLGMQIGGQRTVKVPPNPTYIERRIFPDIPEDAVLVYEITLIDLQEMWDPKMENRLAPSDND